jgi:alkylation response protein AidB-like acyl-CoA dehydrogenase
MHVIENTQAALSNTVALAGGIAARACATEDNRRVADETIAELREAGLFNLLTPKMFGGSELGFGALVEVTAAVAEACGSTGWVYGVLAGHSWMLNFFPEDAQHEVFAQKNTLIATVFRCEGETVPEGDGFRIRGGGGRFCSGVDFAEWVIIGNPVKRAGAAPDMHFFLIPRLDIEVIDDWFTVGMRGTGSRSIKIDDAFIPRHRAVSLSSMIAGNAPGTRLHQHPVYKMPFNEVTPYSIIGAPLGMARAAVKDFGASLGKSVSKMDELTQTEQSATFARLGAAASHVDAAMAIVLEDAARIDNADDPTALPHLVRARFGRNWAYASQTARRATNEIFEAAGGSGIYNSSSLQRIWRDINSSAQHFAFGADKAMTNYGRLLAGLPEMAFKIPQKPK